MRNAIKQAPALKPLSAIYSAITDTLVHVPMHGGGGGSINLAGALAITKGSPTKITLASTPSPLPMPGTYVKLASVVPADYNGYFKVIAANGANVWLDVDSGAFADWSSGGAMTFNVLYDRLGNLTPRDIKGTVSTLWANPADGMTAHSAGSYCDTITAASLGAFDLSAFSGFLVLSAKILAPATPSADEYIFSLGRSSASGGYSGSGAICMSLSGGQVVLTFRPRTVAGSDSGGAGGGTNTFVYSSVLGTTAGRTVTFLLDLRSTSSATIYAYLDGVLKAAAAITLTNLIDWPGITNGMSIGANLNGSLVASEYLGSAVTSSQARVQNLIWWKTTKSLTTVQRAIIRHAQTGELPREVV